MRVLYVSNSLFPWGQAYATRIREIAHVFADLGWDFHALVDHSAEAKSGTFEHGSYRALMAGPTRWSRFRATAVGVRAARRAMDELKPDLLIIGNLYDRYPRLVRLARQRDVPVILEICEWFSPDNWKFARAHPYARAYFRAMAGGYDSADGALTISRVLEDRFRSVMPTVRIPTILDVEQLPFSRSVSGDVVRIAQVGFPGRNKELIAPILEGIAELGPSERSRLRFEVFGPSEAQLRENLGGVAGLLDELCGTVMVHGRIPQQEVADLYTRFHHTIFIRPHTRANAAGFPTKLAESMAAGTPVIANQTGDVELYLRDGVNGFLTGDRPAEIADTLRGALAQSPIEREAMRAAARRTALEAFHYAGFADTLADLTREVRR